METFAVRDLTFTYPGENEPALRGLDLTVQQGELVVICGLSGSGKTTLLRNLKPILAPHGTRSGSILFQGRDVQSLDQREQASRIGYVLQSPDAQIVTDKVWHELAFGLESLGMDTKTIRLRVAEMASFFGIQTWFHRNVNELSGGQKQILNLASVMAMQPDVLLLDEPTSQLDPIAAADFFDTVRKINRDLGTTVIITEHRLENILPMADRVVVLDWGSVVADDTPANAGAILAQKNHPMFIAMPTPLQCYATLYNEGIGKGLDCPVDVRTGRQWLDQLFAEHAPAVTKLPADEEHAPDEEPVIVMKDVWFRYRREDPDVIRDLQMTVHPRELFCIVGGNGTGKSTTLNLAAGILKPYRGDITVDGVRISKGRSAAAAREKGRIGVLPQDPQTLFTERTVWLDLADMFDGAEEEPLRWSAADTADAADAADAAAEKLDTKIAEKIREVAELTQITHLLDHHPYDLSGGEQQRAALAKILLRDPQILLLDEPTKGIDNRFKKKLAEVLDRLKQRGVTIVMVSHDVEFCGRYGDRCAMFFDGKIITTNTPRTFFSGNSFYTTAANRMSRHLFENAVNVDDVVELVRANLGAPEGPTGSKGPTETHESKDPAGSSGPQEPKGTAGSTGPDDPNGAADSTGPQEPKGTAGSTGPDVPDGASGSGAIAGQGVSLSHRAGRAAEPPGPTSLCESEAAGSVGEIRRPGLRGPSSGVLTLCMLGLAAATIYAGFFLADNKHYMAVSLLLILYTMIPFFAGFERSKPKARELVILAVLIATAVAGRAAFFMIPNFKPILAIVIIAGAGLGKQSGFLVGAMSAFVSNFLFGQGPWTPWQMIAMALVGYLAGLLFHRGIQAEADAAGSDVESSLSGKRRILLMVFGGVAVFFLYGAIVDLWTILVMTPDPTVATAVTVYGAAIYFNLVHAGATVIFLFLLARPMIGKLNRVKRKYGMTAFGGA